METQQPFPKRVLSPPIFGPCLLFPNNWIDQDATWYGGRPRLKRHCVTWELSSRALPKKEAELSIFGPCLLAIRLHGSRCHLVCVDSPWPRPHCARWGPSSPPKNRGTAPICGPCLLWRNCSMTRWIKMPLGMIP